MHTTVPVGTALNGQAGLNGIAGNQDYLCTVLLRRLANPNVVGNNDPAQSFYNPFVTVDYIDGVPIYDATIYDNTQARDGQGTPTRPVRHKMSIPNPMTADPPRRSWGRLQPFRAAQIIDPKQNPNAPTSMPWSTFTRQNGDNPLPATGGQNIDEWFDWPTHLDRQVSSPMELLNVSGFKPHEFTQQFILGAAGPIPSRNIAPNTPAKNKQKHLAPWFDYLVDDSATPATVMALQSRLSRGLEMLGTNDRTAGATFGGRVMGKVNINTVWSTTNAALGTTAGDENKRILRALADALGTTAAPDPRSGNFFTQDDVDNLFKYLVFRRTLSPNGIPGNTDRPFWSLAMPSPVDPATGMGTDSQYPVDVVNTPPYNPQNARGLNRTLVGDVVIAPNPPFQMTDIADPTGSNHPYIQKELLQKLTGHLTTRSNVFAVYVTTGFFNVRDPNSNPPKLGSELTLNTTDPMGPMRHKMFAIVDRINLTQDVNNFNASANNVRLQGPRPIYFPYTPVAANGNTITPLTQTDAGTAVTLTVPAYPWNGGMGPNGGVMVRDTIDHNGDLSRSGNVDNVFTDKSGEWWEIRPGTRLYLANGDSTNPNSDAEVVQVTNVGVIGAAPNQTFWVQFQTNKRHTRGGAVCTQQVGNPGPQPLPINYEAPPYSNSVVPFRQILQ